MMDVRAIRNDDDLTWALREIEPYFDREPEIGTPEAERFDVLTALIEAYESRHHPIPESDPIELLHYAIEHLGRSQAELAELLGSRSRASEILGRKRGMTLEQIRAISEAWKIPIAALAQPYPVGSQGMLRRKRATVKTSAAA
ncbi:MAG TPA: XRE family transcriptional regulator [Methylobacterium sp.]|jgi:HTH-type transcriptional regulator/antitoxin HigA|uniref:helix-turn-helix domain-containing protein n=1 Tax=Methylorubrum sp. B1-46 TaxID=2897334 RepID=UPI001E494F89|nr:XRE family transcriptional regulator [Methylorubrum sp. B1-46]UGB24508.1 XRE family transcriptional regulator [Methylorubrum sp. B1-46]HEV2541565.1 XRE family transcriptional regulator [Methylobacterium sp.]